MALAQDSTPFVGPDIDWFALSPGIALVIGALLLLVIGALPFWEDLRRRSGARAALGGINAAVVGLLIAAFYDPVWTVGITGAGDFALALAAFLLLFIWQASPWAVVILCALGGGLIAAV